MFLVAIIPGHADESRPLNHFREPAVKELNASWKGVKVNTHKRPSVTVQIQVAVLCLMQQTFQQQGNFVDSLAIVQREDARTVTKSSLVVLESRGIIVALKTGISGQKDLQNNIEEMLTK